MLPPDHRSAGRRRVRMAELADEPFISYRAGARLRELLVAAGREAGFEPRVTLESNESQRIRRLVARGLGVAILPRSDADRARGRGLRGHARSSRRSAATSPWPGARAGACPGGAEFLELARETFDGAPDRADDARPRLRSSTSR